MKRSNPRRALAACGFTLIELMVVLIIIAVIISIVLPALGHARKLARKATTQSMMTNICNAAAVFMNDNRRAPGYFTAQEMGDSQNLTQGLPALANVMLDLAGGIDPDQQNPPATDLHVGPGTTATTQVWVKIGRASCRERV